jgi:glycosyltransferase involved in cell wall biosynthesis
VASVLGNRHESFELLVIDQSEDDSTRQVLGKFEADSRLRYVHLDQAGLSYAYNVGIEQSSAPLLAFTDDDCVAPPDWLTSIERAFNRHPDVEMLYGQTLAAPALRGASGVLPSLEIEREEKLGAAQGFRIYGMGANFALRRSLIGRIGAFDEALGGGGPLRSSQDFDLQFRAYRAGATCLLSPDVWVDHYGIREGAAWRNTQVAYGVGDGAFYMKHIRCGDALALRLLAARILRLSIRVLLNPLRRRPTQWPYLRSYFTGMHLSLKYRVNRRRRLYQYSRAAGR